MDYLYILVKTESLSHCCYEKTESISQYSKADKLVSLIVLIIKYSKILKV